MNWIQEDGYYYNEKGNLLRKNQDSAPSLKVGDRFFDVANGRWATLLRIRSKEEALGAPFEALYDACDNFDPFIGTAMHADIGEVL
jgi:hypothetical protein|tara:strand:+ start:823 stop:1080 length:258 start_codon:yes stop_codon:yes gene_type:complete